MKKISHSILGIVLSVALAAPAGAAGRPQSGSQRSTRTTKPQREPTLAELRRDANRAAGKLGKAQADVARLNDQIVKVGRQVQGIRNDIEPLKKAVTRRTTAVYKVGRGFDAVAGITQRNPVKSALGAKLVSGANSEDSRAIAELNRALSELQKREAELTAKRSAQEAALGRMDAERQAIETKLQAMVRANKEMQARTAKAQAAAARASRGKRTAQVVVDPASIPVVTNFICPIRGPLAFADTWGDPRSGGRRHQGTDLMSPSGTDNVAVVSGTFERHHSGAGGLAVYLHGDDGHTYYYAHLREVVGSDRRVAQGELIGKTGATGNARGGSPHTHFEFHPEGGKAHPSYALLKAACG